MTMAGNFHASPEFLACLAETIFARQPTSIEVAELRGLRFRLLFASGRPVSRLANFPAYHEALGESIPRTTVLHGLDFTAGPPAPIEAELMLRGTGAPTVLWGGFPTFGAYERSRHLGGWRRDLERQMRRLEREVGPVSFREHESTPEALNTLLDWKSQQAEREHWRAVHALSQTRRLYHGLADRGLQSVATLRAGDQVIAGATWTSWHGRRYFRLTVFDPAFARYSPGMILLRSLLQTSFAAGDQEMDLLLGLEPYKLRVATHIRPVYYLGQRPLAERLARRLPPSLRRRFRRSSFGQRLLHRGSAAGPRGG